MEKNLIIIGLLFNSLVIVVNRFIKKIPDWIYLPLLILGIVLIITGALLTNK